MCGDIECKEEINRDHWGNYELNPEDYPEIFENFSTYTCSKLKYGFNRIFIRSSKVIEGAEEITCTSCYLDLSSEERKKYRMQRHYHKIDSATPDGSCSICEKVMLNTLPARLCQKCIFTFLNHEVYLELSYGIHHNEFDD